MQKAIKRYFPVFVLPTLIAFTIGFLAPFVLGVYLSFCKFTTVTDARFIGLGNYAKILGDGDFLHSLWFTALFTIVTVLLINIFAFAVAMLLTKKIKGTNIFRTVFFMPNLIGGIVLLVYPLLFSFALSFSELQNFTTYSMEWVGLENYRRAFLEDVDYITCITWLFRQLFYNMPLIVIFSLLMAILVSRDIRGKGFFRSVFFLPVLIGTGYVMQQLENMGVNSSAMDVARQLILTPQVQMYLPPEMFQWLSDFLSSITYIMWHSGVQIIIFLVGIQKIPISLYESARVDSATEWEMFWKITLPALRPMILINGVYILVFLATTGINEVIATINDRMFVTTANGGYGIATAMAWIYTLSLGIALGLLVLVTKERRATQVTVLKTADQVALERLHAQRVANMSRKGARKYGKKR